VFAVLLLAVPGPFAGRFPFAGWRSALVMLGWAVSGVGLLVAALRLHSGKVRSVRALALMATALWTCCVVAWGILVTRSPMVPFRGVLPPPIRAIGWDAYMATSVWGTCALGVAYAIVPLALLWRDCAAASSRD
jgi:hypothetical protein